MTEFGHGFVWGVVVGVGLLFALLFVASVIVNAALESEREWP